MLTAVIALGALAAVIGLVLGYAAIRFRVESDPVVERIDGAGAQVGTCDFLSRAVNMKNSGATAIFYLYSC